MLAAARPVLEAMAAFVATQTHPTAKHNAIPPPATIVEWVFLSPVPTEAPLP